MGSASQINDFSFLLRRHWFKAAIKWFENLMFTFVHITIVSHYFWKDVFVSKDASFWNLQFIRVSFHCLLEFFYSCENRIDLEGESPSFRFFVVFLKHIDIFSSEILPLCNRFLNPFSLRNLLSEKLKKCRFSTTDVSFNRKAIVIGSSFRVDEVLKMNLIMISR